MSEKDYSKAKIVATYVSAAAGFSLAAALVYFTTGLIRVADEIPDILQTVNRQVPPVVEESAGMRALVPAILDEVRQTRAMLPPLLAEVRASRQWADPVIHEYARTNAQIPAILAEVRATREALPPVLATVDNATQAVHAASEQIEAVRPLVPEVLAEVKATREAIPVMLEHADALVSSAREAGKEASRGAVTGVFSGILMAPFVFVGDVGQRLLGDSSSDAEKLDESDYDLVEAASSSLLHSGHEGDRKSWVNKDTGASGYVRLVEITEDFDTERECRELEIVVQGKDVDMKRTVVVLCQDEDGKWDFKS